MQGIKRFRTGPRMSQAVASGNLVFISGQVASQSKGGTVEEQTKEVLAKVDDLLAEAGTDKTRLLSASIWLAEISGFAEMNSVWDAWVHVDNPPARACVEAKLANAAYAVEIAAIAAV